MRPIEEDILNEIITAGGINGRDLRENLGDSYTSNQIRNAMTRLRSRDLIETIDGLYYATAELPPAPFKVKAKQPDPAPACSDVGDETEHVGAGPDEQIEAVPTTAKPATPSTPAEVMARKIRECLRTYNYPDEPVTKCVTNLVNKQSELQHENTSLYYLISSIRQAAGDGEGKLMQDKLIKHIEQLHRDAEEARAVRRYFAGFGKEQHLQDLVQRLNGHSLMLGKIAHMVEEHCEDGATTFDAVEAILTDLQRLHTQEKELLEIANRYPFTDSTTPDDLVRVIGNMAQIIDNPRSATPVQPAANESAPDLKQAINRLQWAISDSHDDETHLQVYYDRVMITSIGKLFEVPSGTHDEIQQFIESLNRISEQVIPEKAA